MFHEQHINYFFDTFFSENVKDQITLNKHSINITGRMFV